jgi:hypothetical protein
MEASTHLPARPGPKNRFGTPAGTRILQLTRTGRPIRPPSMIVGIVCSVARLLHCKTVRAMNSLL